MVFYRVLLGIGCFTVAVVLSLFVSGLRDGAVNSDNILLRLQTPVAVVALLILAIWWRSSGRLLRACMLLLLLALPAILAAFLAVAPAHWA